MPRNTIPNAGRSLAATMRQGAQMLAGKDVPNYTLLFLNPTKNQKQGDYKNVILSYLELGRSSKCDIQYGEDYLTVSRRHAAISIKDNHFTLQALPEASNPTLVNGSPVTQHSLQNGDEIQLSYDGPKLRFNTSVMKTSTMGMTARMAMWGRQALRPYRYAVMVLSFLLIGTAAFAVWNKTTSDKQIAEANEKIEGQQEAIAKLESDKEAINTEISEKSAKLANMEEKLKSEGQSNAALKRETEALRNTIASLNEKQKRMDEQVKELKKQGIDEGYTDVLPPPNSNPSSTVPTSGCRVQNEMTAGVVRSLLPKENIYMIRATHVELPSEANVTIQEITVGDLELRINKSLWSGTGFLTSNGKLITAGHVIKPWLYDLDNDLMIKLNYYETTLGLSVEIHFEAVDQTGHKVNFAYNECRVGEGEYYWKEIKDNAGNVLYKLKKPKNNSFDWAYIPVGNRGSHINIGIECSSQVQSGDKLYSWGYPKGDGLQAPSNNLTPFYGELTVGRAVQSDRTIYTTDRTFTSGNSGGPIFAIINNKPVVVGIVSAGIDSNIGVIVPIGNVL